MPKKYYIKDIVIDNNFTSKNSMDFKEISWLEATTLIDDKATNFIMSLRNDCIHIYMNHDLYIVMALNPFSKALVTSDSSLLNDWISNMSFPAKEKANSFYLKNENVIEDLKAHIPTLKDKLLKLVNIEVPPKSDEEIERIYEFLIDNKLDKKYELNFIVVLGDYLLSSNEKEILSWGLIRDLEFLNPITRIVLLKIVNKDVFYFDLENKVRGKWGFNGISMLNYDDQSKWKRASNNEILDILR